MLPDPTRRPDGTPDVTADHVPEVPSTHDVTGAYVPEAPSTEPAAPPGPPLDLPAVPGYEVTGEIARGGMGRVLAARDPAFGREVAIKVLLPGAATAHAAKLFARESYLTGRLTHPGIPPAHQLGTLADGSPFLAMKLVRGRTLADLLKARPDPAHDLPRFVGVFEQVCQAVGYAHSQGVVHRDIKPANVMVGAFGEVQVMDWGLAFEPATDAVEAGKAMGTPAYMAPEQARGEPVDARADVFALGGMLCEVLTSRRPFVGKSGAEAMRQAVTGDVADAHRRLDACGADRELIELAKRCLSPDRDARPADGTAVAAEVAAYRAGVEARLRTAERERAAAEARAAEQRRKRRAQLIAGVAVMMLVAGAGGVAVWRVLETANQNAEQARLESEDRNRKAGAALAAGGLLDQAEAALAARDADRAESPLHQAAARVAEAGGDFAGRLARARDGLAILRDLDAVDDYRWTAVEGRYPSRASVVQKWADVFTKAGLAPGAAPPAEAAARVRASPVKSALVAALDGWLARTQSEPVRALLAAVDPDPFRDEVRHALAGGGRWWHVVALAGRAEWAAQPTGLAVAYAATPGVPPTARRAVLARGATARPDDFGLLMSLGETYPINIPGRSAADRAEWFRAAVALRPRNAFAHNNLGTVLSDRADPDGAAAAFREAIRLDPTIAQPHNNLGTVMYGRKNLDGAEAEYREAVRLDPTFANPHHNLGLVLRDRKNLAGAEAEYREAIRLDPTLLPPRYNLGNLLRDRGDLDGAEAVYRAAIRLDPAFALPHNGLGNVLHDRREYAAAEAAYREAIRLDPMFAFPHDGLGNVLSDQGKLNAAVAAYREAIRLDPKLALPHNGLGLIHEEQGELAEAEAAYRTAVRLDPQYPTAHTNLGNVLLKQGRQPEAVVAYRQSIRLDPTNPHAHNNLGVAHEERLELAEAEAAYRAAVRLDPRRADAHNNLGDVLRKQGRHAAAAAAYRDALVIQPALGPARDGLAYCERVLRGEVPTAPPPRPVNR